jgi:hypothetical protein
MKFIFIQWPGGWPGPKVQTDMPVLVNLRQDPFEAHADASWRNFGDQRVGIRQ